MSGPPPTKRTLMMVEAVQAGGTMAAVGEMFGVSKQRVSAAVARHTFPSVGPPGGELYIVGKCRVCQIPLGAYKPEEKDLCGRCESTDELALD